MIQEIKPRTGFSAYYEKWIEPRRLELAEHMGTLKKIRVIDAVEIELQRIIEQDSDPAGDFSGASYDEWGGR